MEHSLQVHVGIIVCEGGYLVVSAIPGEDDEDMTTGITTAVYTSLEGALKFAERALKKVEGSPEFMPKPDDGGNFPLKAPRC